MESAEGGAPSCLLSGMNTYMKIPRTRICLSINKGITPAGMPEVIYFTISFFDLNIGRKDSLFLIHITHPALFFCCSAPHRTEVRPLPVLSYGVADIYTPAIHLPFFSGPSF